MSRIILYKDEKLTVVSGEDRMLGTFVQIYDKEMEHESSEGEGIVLDWSEAFGYETNLTGIPNIDNVLELVDRYIVENMDRLHEFEINLN